MSVAIPNSYPREDNRYTRIEFSEVDDENLVCQEAAIAVDALIAKIGGISKENAEKVMNMLFGENPGAIGNVHERLSDELKNSDEFRNASNAIGAFAASQKTLKSNEEYDLIKMNICKDLSDLIGKYSNSIQWILLNKIYESHTS